MGYTTFAKTGIDTMGILDVQTAAHIPFNFYMDWTVLRVCLLCSMTGSDTDDNAGWTYHSMGVTNDAKSMFSCGWKDGSDILPGVAGSKFIGYTTTLLNTDPQLNPGGGVAGYIHTGGLYFLRGAYIGSTPVTGSLNDYSFAVSSPTQAMAATSYNARHLYQLTVIDRGLATQALNLYVHNVSSVGGVAEGTDAECLAAIEGLIVGAETFTIPWQSGGVPYDLPTKFFIHSPMSPDRLRISNFVMKVMCPDDGET